jgi:hypothetical protein
MGNAISNSEHRKMRAKQQHVFKEMNQYTNNTNRKWFLNVHLYIDCHLHIGVCEDLINIYWA